MTAALIITLFAPVSLCAMEHKGIRPVIISQFIEEAKKNTDWKRAIVTGEQEQIVFMNVSSYTNPDNNEIGIEIHQFDQAILIVEGKGRAVIEEMQKVVEEGDLIFIPKGTQHNVINLGQDSPLKLISFYSDTDIPKGSVYKKKSDEKHH